MTICRVPDNRSYWVVRADAGHYYDHFMKHGVIALAHLDLLSLPDHGDIPFLPSQVELIKLLSDKHRASGNKRGTTTSHANQVKAFVKVMKVGDWVMAVGKWAICFGRITGKPRLNRDSLSVEYGENKERVVEMHHNLRRSVSWGPAIKRDVLPFGLLSSMKARQALFNVDQHVESIYHTLYPVFAHGEEIFFSIRINSEERISNYSISSLLSYMNEVEVIAKFADRNVTEDRFDVFFKEHATRDGVTTTTKAEFHSPGEIWAAVQASVDSFPVISILIGSYIAIFGNTKLGFDGLVDIETRQHIWRLILSRYEKHGIPGVRETLKLSQPKLNTHALEADDNDEV